MLSEQEIQEVREFVIDNLNGKDIDEKYVTDELIDKMVKFITEDCYGSFFKIYKWVEITEQNLIEDFADDDNCPVIEDEDADEEDVEMANDAVVSCFVDLWFKTLKENI